MIESSLVPLLPADSASTSIVDILFSRSQIAIACLDQAGAIIYVNPAFTQIVEDSTALSVVSFFKVTLGYEPRSPLQSAQYEYHDDESMGQPRWLDIILSPASVPIAIGGSTITAFATVRVDASRSEVSHLRSEVYRLTHDKLHDELTGLPNWLAMEQELDRAIKRPDKCRCSVLYMDLDGFKPVNDTLGHAAGDLLLIATAQRMRALVGDRGIASRLHGDEFAVLLNDVSLEDAVEFGKAVELDIKRPFTISDRIVNISATLGLVMLQDDHRIGETVLEDADAAMFAAKRQGRARVQVFDDAMRYEARRHAQLATDLRSAIRGNEFSLMYQPVIDMKSDRVEGMEALLRWQHPQYGEILPTEFIELAEKNNSILELGLYALRSACSYYAQFIAEMGPKSRHTLAVNVSGRQLKEASFVDEVQQIMDETGISGRRLLMEITESAIVGNERQVAETLKALRKMRVRLCIDDFGIEHSSLARLVKFPIEFIKIDRSFVYNPENPMTLAEEPLIGLIVSFAQNVDNVVIAEGIENERHVELLRNLGVILGQGFHYSKPLPPEQFLDYVKRKR